ncbi:MAG: ABC transporter ATP-binding protein [Comamonas sp.]
MTPAPATDSPPPPAHPAIDLRGITKRFGTVVANDQVDLQVAAGSIHGVVGENGAGKSTLMSILYGFYQADEGEIRVHGQRVAIRDSAAAIAHGIGMVHQHFMLVGTLSALDNILLGAEGGWRLGGARRRARAHLEQLMARYQLLVDLDAPVDDMPVGEQQRLEILKALYRGARILILDEPTGVLTPQEAGQLFAILRELRAQQVTVIIITHKLQEIMDVTDNVTVMRAGRVVAERRTAETRREELAELMVGRPVRLQVDKRPASPDSPDAPRAMPALSVRGLGLVDARGCTRLADVSFDLHPGEILGVAGVSGNGQTELLRTLAGLLQPTSGQMTLATGAAPRDFSTQRWLAPSELRALGCAHVPEDRLSEAVAKDFSLQESAVLGYQDDPALAPAGWLSPAHLRRHAMQLIEALDVRPAVPALRTADMSGGNQQKLVLARELVRRPRLMLVGQPTRGVDIGAIERIYGELARARDAGTAILLVSVELEEILALSDRIMVMNGGRVTGIVPAASASARELGLLMTADTRSAPTDTDTAIATP